MSANQPLIDVLARLREHATQRRRRSSVEAPESSTRHYVDFMFAYGVAALGEPAGELPVPLDPDNDVHSFLTTLFTLRVVQARTGVPPTNPESLRLQYGELLQVSRYKIGRIRQVSEILEPGEARITTDELEGQNLPALDDAVDDEARAQDVEALLREAASVSIHDAHAPLVRAFHALRWVSEDRAAPLLVSAFETVRTCGSAELYGRVIDAMGWIGWGELMAPAIDGLHRTLVDTPDVVPALRAAIAGLRRIGLADEVARLLPFCDGVNHPVRLAGARIYGGDLRAQEVFASTMNLDKRLSHASTYQVLQMIAQGLELAPVEDCARGIDLLMQTFWRRTTDSFGTNSHFCITVLQFIDMLVMALVRAEVGVPHDRARRGSLIAT